MCRINTFCIYTFDYHPATSLMIQDFHLTTKNETIFVEWISPTFRPKFYIVLISCRYACATTEYFIVAFKKEAMTTSFSTQVQPNSICHVKLTASYNPASFDMGLSHTINTPAASKYTRKRHICSLSFHLVNFNPTVSRMQ